MVRWRSEEEEREEWLAATIAGGGRIYASASTAAALNAQFKLAGMSYRVEVRDFIPEGEVIAVEVVGGPMHIGFAEGEG